MSASVLYAHLDGMRAIERAACRCCSRHQPRPLEYSIRQNERVLRLRDGPSVDATRPLLVPRLPFLSTPQCSVPAFNFSCTNMAASNAYQAPSRQFKKNALGFFCQPTYSLHASTDFHSVLHAFRLVSFVICLKEGVGGPGFRTPPFLPNPLFDGGQRRGAGDESDWKLTRRKHGCNNPSVTSESWIGSATLAGDHRSILDVVHHYWHPGHFGGDDSCPPRDPHR